VRACPIPDGAYGADAAIGLPLYNPLPSPHPAEAERDGGLKTSRWRLTLS